MVKKLRTGDIVLFTDLDDKVYVDVIIHREEYHSYLMGDMEFDINAYPWNDARSDNYLKRYKTILNEDW